MVWKVRRVLMGGWSGYVRDLTLSISLPLPFPPLPPHPPFLVATQSSPSPLSLSLPRCLDPHSNVTPQLPRSVTNCLDYQVGPSIHNAQRHHSHSNRYIDIVTEGISQLRCILFGTSEIAKTESLSFTVDWNSPLNNWLSQKPPIWQRTLTLGHHRSQMALASPLLSSFGCSCSCSFGCT